MRETSFDELNLLAASDDPAEVDRAHEHALVAMAREPRLRVVSAMAYDRARALRGRAQKFGTQAVLRAGERVLWPVDPGTTDSERAKWMLKPLANLAADVDGAPLVPKQPLRQLARHRRQQLAEPQLAAIGEQIATRGVGEVDCESHDVVAAYWPLPGEADPRELARRLADCAGARLALPFVLGDEMEFREWTSDDALVPAGFGTMGPSTEAIVVQPTVVLAPLVAFDAAGNRLGQGKGYYDRHLEQLAASTGQDGRAPRIVGIACSCQELPVVPTEVHDRALDLLVTELGVTRFPN